MTVTTTANSISYAGNGTSTAFAFPYIFFVPSDLVVTLIVSATNETVTPPPVLNGLATYDYTVTGDVTDGEYASGGTVTFNTAPPATHTLLMQRAVPATQTVTLIDNTKFPATTINVEFDKLTILAQQSAYLTTTLTTTALQIPSSEAGLVVTAVPVAARANKILLWDDTGNLSTIDPAALIGGSVPGGPAGGDLAGTYPTPTIKASVALTGNPTAPTPTYPDNDTSVATTAYVTAALAAGAATGDFMASSTGFGMPLSLTKLTPTTINTGNAGGWYSTSTGRFTPPAGRYYINVQMSLNIASGATQLGVQIRKNGAAVVEANETTGAANYWSDISTEGIFDANGSDYFEFWGYSTVSSSNVFITFLAYPISGIKGPPGDPGGMLTSGAGAPTGVSAAKGTLYINTTATTTTTRLYINTDGGTTWANFTASA